MDKQQEAEVIRLTGQKPTDQDREYIEKYGLNNWYRLKQSGGRPASQTR